MSRRRPVQSKTLKDYIVPIVWVLVFFIVVINLIVSGWSENTTPENWSPVDKPSIELVVPWDVKAYVRYPNDKQVEMTETAEILQWERIYVKTGKINLTEPKINIDSNTEIKFNDTASYTLMSWNIFAQNSVKENYELMFADVVLSPNSVASFKQNAVSSQVSVLSWTAVVTLNSWLTADVVGWKQATVYSNNTNDKDLDLSEVVKEIPDYELEDEWFVYNNAKSFLDSTSSLDEWESSESKLSLEANKDREFVMFEVEDETSVSSTSLLITWDVLANDVAKITLNGDAVNIDKANGTFSKEVPLNKSVNDIVYRVYDEEDILLQKDILTIYSSGKTSGGTTTALGNSELETYSINKDFGFVTPNPANISGGFYTIKGFVPAWVVEYVKVNNYRLRKFASGDTTWRYHADEQYGLLKDGSNLYKVEYYDKDDKLLTTSLYIINKTEEQSTTNTQKISDEAQ